MKFSHWDRSRLQENRSERWSLFIFKQKSENNKYWQKGDMASLPFFASYIPVHFFNSIILLPKLDGEFHLQQYSETCVASFFPKDLSAARFCLLTIKRTLKPSRKGPFSLIRSSKQALCSKLNTELICGELSRFLWRDDVIIFSFKTIWKMNWTNTKINLFLVRNYPL